MARVREDSRKVVSTTRAVTGKQESVALTSAELEQDQTLADAEQSRADADQTAADHDQSAADSDQSAADEDQAASDSDQAASDVATDARRLGSQERQDAAQERVDGAASRDAVADARDRASSARMMLRRSVTTNCWSTTLLREDHEGGCCSRRTSAGTRQSIALPRARCVPRPRTIAPRQLSTASRQQSIAAQPRLPGRAPTATSSFSLSFGTAPAGYRRPTKFQRDDPCLHAGAHRLRRRQRCC